MSQLGFVGPACGGSTVLCPDDLRDSGSEAAPEVTSCRGSARARAADEAVLLLLHCLQLNPYATLRALASAAPTGSGWPDCMQAGLG